MQHTQADENESLVLSRLQTAFGVLINSLLTVWQSEPNFQEEGVSSPSKAEGGDEDKVYTMRQAKLTRELQQLNAALALKEDLVFKAAKNDDQMTVIRSKYEVSFKHWVCGRYKTVKDFMNYSESFIRSQKNTGSDYYQWQISRLLLCPSQKAVTELGQEVDKLTKEKDDLLQELRMAKTSAACSK